MNKTDGGTWLDWRDAWRDMGRTEEEIVAEAAAREERARSRGRFVGNGDGNDGVTRCKRRFRTWGKCDENVVKMRARLAPIAGYFLRSLKNELARPSWGFCGRAEMSTARLYALATAGGKFGAAEKSVRSRDFGRVIEWCLNTLKNATAWGFNAAEAAIARRWLENPDRDAPMIFPAGTWQGKAKDYGVVRAYSQSGGDGCTDANARVSFYESKKHLNDTAPAEAGFSPLAPTPLVGAGAFTVREEEAGFFCSKGGAGLADGAGRSAEPGSDAREGEAATIARFEGKLPRRLWWLVWKWLPAFGRLHAGKNVAWSEAHFVSWFKSCLVAGKRCVDLFDLYEEKLMKWHGLASDWRVPGDRELHPRGLFAELYRTAGTLPGMEARKN